MLPWNIIAFIDSKAVTDWLMKHAQLLIIMTQVPPILANGFFTLAIAVNSTKWAKLVVSIKFQDSDYQLCLFRLSYYNNNHDNSFSYTFYVLIIK